MASGVVRDSSSLAEREQLGQRQVTRSLATEDRALQALGVNSLPTNVLLDRERRPVQIYRGYSPEVPKEIRRLVLEMDGGAGESGDK